MGVRLSLALVPLLMMGGCHEFRDGVRENPADGEELPILRRASGTHSHETRAMQIVVRDPATLARVPIEDVPVDFSREMLLIVTLGRVTSDRFGVSIDRVWRQGHELRVAIAVTSPPPNAPLAMASPYCIAVVPWSDLNVADFAPEPPQRTRSWDQSPLPAGW
ncbi:MAG: protease complex subunit PrcB family protein [Phycisphaerae bacterium]|nr:protease complex subunit PrcB family protein [Phycisphaerae bacterium]